MTVFIYMYLHLYIYKHLAKFSSLEPEIWKDFVNILRVLLGNAQQIVLSLKKILRFKVKILPESSGFRLIFP